MMTRWILVLLFAFPVFEGAGQDSPLDYLNEISREYEEVVRAQWRYARALIGGGDYQPEKTKLLRAIRQAEEQIEVITPYRGESALKDSVLLFLQLNRQMVEEDYTRLADLKSLESRSFDELDAFLYDQENACRRLGKLAISLRKEEEAYARRHDIRLVSRDDRFARRLLELNDLFSYYNKLYLAFYKAYSQELIVFRHIEEKDPEQIRPALRQLAAYAEEGLRTVRKEGGYKGNKTLYEAALNCLTFYQREAEKDLTIVADYYDKLDQLEKLKKDREEGKLNADEYNSLVREINAAGTQLNKLNEKLNQERARVLYNWNEASSGFLVIQVP